MWLKIVGPPDVVDRRLANALALRHGPATPMRHPCRFGLQGSIHDANDLLDLILGLRARPGATSHRPSRPPSPKRARHRITVLRFSESRFAIETSDSPAAAPSTIRQRKATCCGVPCAAVHCWSFSRSTSESRHDFPMPQDSREWTRISSYLLHTALGTRSHQFARALVANSIAVASSL